MLPAPLMVVHCACSLPLLWWSTVHAPCPSYGGPLCMLPAPLMVVHCACSLPLLWWSTVHAPCPSYGGPLCMLPAPLMVVHYACSLPLLWWSTVHAPCPSYGGPLCMLPAPHMVVHCACFHLFFYQVRKEYETFRRSQLPLGYGSAGGYSKYPCYIGYPPTLHWLLKYWNIL